METEQLLIWSVREKEVVWEKAGVGAVQMFEVVRGEAEDLVGTEFACEACNGNP